MTRAELMPLLNEVHVQVARVQACSLFVQNNPLAGSGVQLFARELLDPRVVSLLAALKKLEDVVLAPDEEC
jgi:hypothetical protein